jgi:predicted transposase/invertase (TIGR01784 family)
MVKVILSSAGKPTDDIHPDVAAFLDYMNGKMSGNTFISEIDDTIRSVKLDGVKEADYMTFRMMIDEEREEAREEGWAEGRAEERKEMTRKMKALGLSAELIMQTTGLSAEDTAGL